MKQRIALRGLDVLVLTGLAFVVPMTFSAQVHAESTLEGWLRVLGISVTPQTKGPSEDVKGGDLWVASLVLKVPQRLTFDGGYRSPIFLSGDQAILALKGGVVVRMSAFGGEPETVVAAAGVTKLIGVNAAEPNETLALTEDTEGHVSIGVVSLIDGRITTMPTGPSQNDRRIINTLNGSDRLYADVTLRVETTTEQGLSGTKAWSDVYVTRPGQPKQNLSQCDDVDCGQPSLSHDRTRVVFVKADGR